MIKWLPFYFKGHEYDLAHLHPFEMKCKQDAVNNKPEIHYNFEVIFSLHCFTSKVLGDNPDLLYRDNRETRAFCFDRYELSKKLPEIVKSIFKKKCYHAKHANYFIFEMVNWDGKTVEYQVYFTISRSSKKRGLLTLYIQSAYPKTRPQGKKKKPIGFKVLAHNTLNNKKIRRPA